MIGMGMSASASLTIAAEAKLTDALQAQLKALIEANCSMQAAMVAKLVAKGVLVDAAEELEEEVEEIDELEELDAELDPFSDDDEIDSEELRDLDAGVAGGDDESDSPVVVRHYTIRVVRRGDSFVCIPPRNPYGNLAQRGSYFAGRVLKALRDQFAIYARVAELLNAESAEYIENGGSVDASPLSGVSAFKGRHKPITQKSLAKEYGFDEHAVGKAVLNARLAWSASSLPLKAVFA